MKSNSIQTDADRVRKMVGLVKDFQIAIEEGVLTPPAISVPARNYDIPIPLDKVADQLAGIADELRCAWGLGGFADEIEAVSERVEDREVLDERMATLADRAAKSPNGMVSGLYLFKTLRRERRNQEDMRLIVKAGGTTYRGLKIFGGDHRYTMRFTRAEVTAELRNDLDNQLGVANLGGSQ